MNKKTFYIVSTLLLIIATVYVLKGKYKDAKLENERIETFKNIHEVIQKKWVNKTFTYPDSLYLLGSSGLYLDDYLNSRKTSFTLVSYLNADCSDCVKELNDWSIFIEEHNLKEKVDMFFIAISSNKEMLKYQIFDQAKFEYPIFYDKNEIFKDLNNLPEKKAYQTFLLRKDKIIYVGSPIQGEVFKDHLLGIFKF